MTPDQVERTFALLFPAGPQSSEFGSHASDDVSATVREVLANVLKLDEVEDGQSFQNYGIESVSAMVFSTKLGKELKLDVQPQWLIEFPTVCSLSAHIKRKMENAAVDKPALIRNEHRIQRLRVIEALKAAAARTPVPAPVHSQSSVESSGQAQGLSQLRL